MELKINHVGKSFGEKTALVDFSLDLGPGVLGLLGPNGAGKSTLMRILATLSQPTVGQVIWNGQDIVKKPQGLRRDLGYLPQDFGVYPNLTPVEFLEYMAAMKGLPMKPAKKRIDELLEALNLTQDRKRTMGGFSGGMKQRVGIAQALLNDPRLLIVDEPTVGLDPEERIRFRNLLSNLSSDRIVILSTHIVSDIESIATHIALLARGRLIIETSPENLLRHVDNKVWQWVVPSSELPRIQDDYLVSSAVHRSDGVYVRVVSDNPPGSGAKVVPSALEDAYLYYVAS
ncbi:ABC transporter ATP-binding protein [Desmospora profundinema]|uniref:ABC-type multidrug transport system ATPase subunit n=1 Tax=Desmospora profundinema TaxID=1571184 RepID=A0ABU1IRT9_9BACL|nr:ABC transporter ATP-binding protein [Desmospora profundinema]MDR6226884.1 ABC-type multidrug transport system ATPase subunit [Desmospora profundinema]